MPSITITITEASDGGYMYDIYNMDAHDIDPEQGWPESVDGGQCTSGSIVNALGMACEQAKTIAEKMEATSPCYDDNPEACGCDRCASGEVRHCPECYDDATDKKDCPMCDGEGAVSRATS